MSHPPIFFNLTLIIFIGVLIHRPIFRPSQKKDDHFVTFLTFITLFGFGYESPSKFFDPLKKKTIIFIVVMVIVKLF